MLFFASGDIKFLLNHSQPCPIVRLWYFCFYPPTAATLGEANHRERHPGHSLPAFEAIVPGTQIHMVWKGRVRK